METDYKEIQISFNKENCEQIYNKLYLEGIKNILEENGEVKIYFSENEKEKINKLKLVLLRENIIKENDFKVSNLAFKNWNKEWENSIEPVEIAGRVIIYPSWKKEGLKFTKDKIFIEIVPKMSFGTGHNETTQLVIELMCDYITGRENRLLDYGCGTGILSITGIKLGIKQAVAIDIDGISIENAREYFKVNSVLDKITLIQTGISNLKESEFDVICANIIRSIIVENFIYIKDKLKTNGKLFLSGILKEEEKIITDLLFNNKFEIVDIRTKSEWLGIHAIKK